MSLFEAVAERERRGASWQRLAFQKLVSRNEDLLHRVELQRKLQAHSGCVNTCSFSPAGDILVSGSDDRHIILWDWATGKKLLRFNSGHTNNVFQARCMPYTNNNTLVTCAADGQVRVSLLKADGTANSNLLFRHSARAHKLALDPISPTCFYSCGEDGVVNHFDLRESVVNAARASLLTLEPPRSSARGLYPRATAVELNAIHVNPVRPWQFAVGGSDEYVRIYDLRQLQPSEGNGRRGQRDAKGAEPLIKLCPNQLVNSGEMRHITCVMYSRRGELLVTYNDEAIYLFEPVHMQLDLPAATPPDDEDKGEPGEEGKAGPSTSSQGQDTRKDHVVQRYSGHRNRRTVKGVNFLGPDDEYVITGSDCGHIFIWGKTDAKLHCFLHGDEDVVNCLEPHPHLPHTFATSGIEHDVKIWAPTAAEPVLPGAEAEAVMRYNQQRRGGYGYIRTASGGIQTVFGIPETLLALLHMARPQGRPGGFLSQQAIDSDDFEDWDTPDETSQETHSAGRGGEEAPTPDVDYTMAATSDSDSEGF